MGYARVELAPDCLLKVLALGHQRARGGQKFLRTPAFGAETETLRGMQCVDERHRARSEQLGVGGGEYGRELDHKVGAAENGPFRAGELVRRGGFAPLGKVPAHDRDHPVEAESILHIPDVPDVPQVKGIIFRDARANFHK